MQLQRWAFMYYDQDPMPFFVPQMRPCEWVIGSFALMRRVFVLWRRCRTWSWDVRSKRSNRILLLDRPTDPENWKMWMWRESEYEHFGILFDQWRRILATHSMWQRRARLRAVYGLRRQLPEGLVHRIWTFLTIFDETEWKIASSRQAWMQEWSPWFEVLLLCAEHDLPAVSSTCT